MKQSLKTLRADALYLDGMILHGNGKLLDFDNPETGEKIRYAQWNTRAVKDCPFRSKGCEADCYATKGNHVFPSVKKDPLMENYLSANVCANFLGLGNAATPMGIQAAQRMATGCCGIASDELCRLIVLNTASIQLIPANVAAVRSALGATSPFDILPAVWITSLCSAGLGLLAAWGLGAMMRHD